MLKRMLTVATVVALAGGVTGCADRDEGVDEGGGGGAIMTPDRDGEDDDDDESRRGRVAPRDD
ncbi:MAG: hypothetical protein ACK46X_00220 [Candidatus Sericytochromatia bacterium]